MNRLVLKIVLWFLLVLAAGTLAHFMVRHPGYVLLAWGEWMVEVTLWAALGLVLVAGLAIWLLVRVLRGVNPVRLARRYREHRDRRTAREETRRAVQAWLSGDEATALTALQRVVKAGGSERLPRLLTLLPERERPDWPERLAAFVEADPQLALAGQALQAEQFWLAGDHAAFVQLFEQHADLAGVRTLQSRYWQSLIAAGQPEKALRRITAAPHLNPEVRERWQCRAGQALIEQACAEGPASPERLKVLPRKLRQRPELVATEVRCLARHDRLDPAFERLGKALERSPDAEELLDLLAELPFEAAAALRLGERLLARTRQPSARLQTALGRLSERESLWGQAESYLQAAWQQTPAADTGLALAGLLERRGRQESALALYKRIASGDAPETSHG